MLIGRGHELQRHHMEIRGVGLVDIPAIFGIRAVRQQKRIEVVVQLEEWDKADVVERTGLDETTTDILDVAIPTVHHAAQSGQEHHGRSPKSIAMNICSSTAASIPPRRSTSG